MEKNQRRSLIIIAVLFVGIVCAVGQYMGAFNAMYALATNPNPGHTWNQMECTTGLCVDTVNNRVGVGTTSPETNLHVVGGFKVGTHTTCNSSGEWNFTTPVSVPGPTVSNHAATKKYVDCKLGFFDIRDGNWYPGILIGDQCWMAKNLAYLPSVVGASTGSDSVAYYYVYGYNGTDVNAAKATTNYSIYGVLYNWTAAQTACPAGWHLPEDSEYKTLEISLGMTPEEANSRGFRGTDEGTKLKSGGSSGFEALMAGDRVSTGGYFYDLGTDTTFWSSSVDLEVPSRVWRRLLLNSEAEVVRETSTMSQGFSVRCLKD